MTSFDSGSVAAGTDLRAAFDELGYHGSGLVALLQDFLVHERTSEQVYRSLGEASVNPALRDRLAGLGRDTARHVQVLEVLLDAARAPAEPPGGAPSAALGAHRLEAARTVAAVVDPISREHAILGLVHAAEAQDHAHWSFLAELVARLPTGPARDVLAGAVEAVEPETDQHLAWARGAWQAMALARVRNEVADTTLGTRARLVEKVKDFFTEDTPPAGR